MKKFIAGMMIAIAFSKVAIAGNFILTIDDKQYEIDLGSPIMLSLDDNRKALVRIEKKSLANFIVDNFSFNYRSDITPTRTHLNSDVYQTVLVSPKGTAILIQEYLSNNPCRLIDFMVDEFLKEEIEYGYEIQKTSESRKLFDGKIVNGKKVISKFKDSEVERHVVCYGIRDAGIIIATQTQNIFAKEDQPMLDLFWDSINLTIQ